MRIQTKSLDKQISAAERSYIRWKAFAAGWYTLLIFIVGFLFLGMAQQKLLYSFMGLGLVLVGALGLVVLVLIDRKQGV